ncbi:TPA: arginase family protein [Candidatus Gracilibacteria bacterium]|nr:arginase family protein [Candidatus Gracilibacteria bacterium]
MNILGIASGIGAEKRGAELGVWDLYYTLPEKFNINFNKIFFTNATERKLDAIENWYNLTKKTQKFITENNDINEQYLFITGDHSNGFCVWNALLKKYNGDMGLIWIDAHLDAHTVQSSYSHNIHGMPISHLLGYGDTKVQELNKNFLDAKNLCFIGTRDYEKAELEFLEQRGVKIFFMKNITKQNIQNTVKEAIEYVSRNTKKFGISIDIDGFDPNEAGATGCFCPNGLSPLEIIKSLKNLVKNPQFCGLEITEFDTKKDTKNQTKNIILKIIASVFNLKL